ncbi:hypothetical protein [Sphingomonas crusticola]|uniref:hypothetical protein n=1 Tax=Sphingomonas crusticola TaxID=1697973 RepID=UPI0013C2F94B|nr:hypothetical protein [Sphingomonas crusticola]
MTRRVRDFIHVPDHSSLDAMIETLIALRDRLPADSQATLRMQGDETFGRHFSISYLRPQTADEAACDARYAQAHPHQPGEGGTSNVPPSHQAGDPKLSLAA